MSIETIPAIDLLDGKCVRLTQGDYAAKTTYSDDPVAMAQTFEKAGATRLHLVDLNGAKAGAPQHLDVLEKIALQTSLILDFGGGIKKEKDVTAAFSAGAAQLNVGSTAVKQKEIFKGWLEKFGAEKFILSADFYNGKIASNGWLEQSELSVADFISQFIANGLQFVMCTDISKDGTLEGPNQATYRDLVLRFPELNFIASGGVSTLNDISTMENIGMYGCVVGKAIYEGKIDLDEFNF